MYESKWKCTCDKCVSEKHNLHRNGKNILKRFLGL